MTVTHKRKTKRSTSAAPASTLAGDLAVAAAETDGGMKYHCDLCLADITDILRIRCAAVECTDFDVCVECFAAGKEGANHRHDHPYRILDKFAYPIVCAEWGGDEEMCLIDAIDSLGLGNWADIAEYVGTKTLEECREHYVQYYLNSPTYPLPSIDYKVNETLVNEMRKKRYTSPDKRSQNVIPPLQAKVQPSHPSNHEIHGYMPGRREFEVEHENEAEVPIKDMIFNEDDGPTEVDLKCTMLDIYNSKLDRRVERKQFVFDRGLLDFKKVQLAERKKSKEEKDALQQTRPFARLMSNDDYNNFVAGLVAEDQIRQRIVQLQEYRRNGITSFAEAENFEQQKRARIAAIARSPFAAASDRLSAKHLNRISDAPSTEGSPSARGSASHHSSSATAQQPKASRIVNANPQPLDLTGCEGVEILTAGEQALCSALRILPRAYLSIKETILRENERRGGLKRREARELVRIDVNKLGKVYDFFVSKGWVTARSDRPSSRGKPGSTSAKVPQTAST